VVKARVPPLGLALLAFGVQRAFAGRRSATKPSRALAAVVGAGSVWMALGAALRFRLQGTTVNPVTPGADSLVTSGPNRLTRNPMYVGMAGVLVANAIMSRSLSAAVPAGCFVWVIDRWQIPVEEAVLRGRFGSEYESYASVTPRWLGRLRGADLR
jgi:protein-S-isoprenylcysteine O-methyltransferase Ste14